MLINGIREDEEYEKFKPFEAIELENS